MIILIVFPKHNESASDIETKYIDINAELYKFINTSKDCYLIEDYDLNPEQLFRWASSLEWSKELSDIGGWF